MLTVEDLAGMTDTINTSLPETLTILREVAGAEDAWGHKARTNPDEITVQGYVHELRGNEEMGPTIAGAVIATGEVRLPFGTAINERDKIGRASGEVLEVVYVRDPSGYGLLLEVGVFSVTPVAAAG